MSTNYLSCSHFIFQHCTSDLYKCFANTTLTHDKVKESVETKLKINQDKGWIGVHCSVKVFVLPTKTNLLQKKTLRLNTLAAFLIIFFVFLLFYIFGFALVLIFTRDIDNHRRLGSVKICKLFKLWKVPNKKCTHHFFFFWKIVGILL